MQPRNSEHDRDDLEQMLAGLPMREPSRMLDERVAATLRDAQSGAGRVGRAGLFAGRWRYAAALIVGAAGVAIGLIAVLDREDSLQTIDTAPEVVAGVDLPGGELIEPIVPTDPETPAIIPTANRFEPDPVRLTMARDIAEETRYTPAGRPYRAVLRQAVDHEVWTDSQTGATMQVTVPREELVVISQTTF